MSIVGEYTGKRVSEATPQEGQRMSLMKVGRVLARSLRNKAVARLGGYRLLCSLSALTPPYNSQVAKGHYLDGQNAGGKDG
jgi:hypothetical protein